VYISADNSFAGHLFFGVGGREGCITEENNGDCMCLHCVIHCLHTTVDAVSVYMSIFVLFLFSFCSFLI
jgi:hypothetical protein